MDSQDDSREEGGSTEDAELHKTSMDTNEKKTEAKLNQESQDELNVRNGNVATNEVLRWYNSDHNDNSRTRTKMIMGSNIEHIRSRSASTTPLDLARLYSEVMNIYYKDWKP